jgi:hypothetical protein
MKPIVLMGEWKLMGKRTIGVTIFPFIFLKKSYFDKQPKEVLETTINHEKIHIKQQIELLVVFFYLWYFLEYYVKNFKYTFKEDVYMNLSFEREAYENESNKDYLKTRKFWSFIKYLIK